LKRRGLTDIVYHVFDTPGKHTFKVNYTIPELEYLIVGATGGGPSGNTPGGGGDVVKGALAEPLPPGEYEIEVGSIGGKIETKVTMVNCNQNADTCRQVPYTDYMNFPTGTYNGVPSGTYLSCGGIRSTPTKMTEEIYAAGGKSSFLGKAAAGGNPGAIKPYMSSRWYEVMERYGGRVPGTNITINAGYPRNQYEYAFPNYSYGRDGLTQGGNPAYTSWSCGQFDMDYLAGSSATGQGGTQFQNCCAWAGQPQDGNCCVNASGGAGGSAKRPGTRQAEPGPGVMSSITGENVEYGHGAGGNVNPKPAKHGVVIIAYDKAKAVANIGPSKSEIDAIVKEYDQKMAQLKAQMEAEKKALLDQNAAAMQEAKQQQEQLIAELTGLKTRYDQLQGTVQTAQTALQTTQEQLTQMNAEYTKKMQDLEIARQEEIKALNAQNQAAADAAKAAQDKLIAELTALKTSYDALMAKAAECPVIPNGTIAVDGANGTMYVAENGTIRPLAMDVYRAMGSPRYTVYQSLQNCPRGAPYMIPQTTPAPTTVAPTSTDPQFPGTLYVIVHAASWLQNKRLDVLAARFGTPALEPFQFKSLEQVFVINNDGYIRSVANEGLYLTNAGDCLSPVLTKEAPLSPWRVSRTGSSPLEYTMVSSCGASLKAALGSQAPILEQGMFGSEVSESWYIVPVGRAEI